MMMMPMPTKTMGKNWIIRVLALLQLLDTLSLMNVAAFAPLLPPVSSTKRTTTAKYAGPTEMLSSLAAEQPLLLGVPIAAAAFASFQILVPPSSLVNSATLDKIVQGTFLNGKELECVYKASRDGWSALDFHQAVDERGSGVVVARSALTGKIFGGYNPQGWRSTDDYSLSTQAFLFCQTNNQVQKYPIASSGNAAVYDYATSGPNFGSADLQIGPPRAAVMGGFAGPDAEDVSANAGSLRQCKSTPGYAYETDKTWPVRGTCTLSQVEVYCKK